MANITVPKALLTQAFFSAWKSFIVIEHKVPTCNKGHEMVQITGLPKGGEYTTVECDICDTGKLENEAHFYHCKQCEFDMCVECAQKRAQKLKPASSAPQTAQSGVGAM